MQFLNGISDLVLAVVCLYVFFRYLERLDFFSTLLWESFVLSVAVAALFGALGFFGLEKAIPISQFFQKLATINGAIGLVGASYSLVTGMESKNYSYAFIALGFIFLALYEVLDMRQLYFWTPVIAMALVVILGLFALISGKTQIGLWLIIGVLFFALGSFRKEIFGISEKSISYYHLLMAAGILSIGMANSKISVFAKK